MINIKYQNDGPLHNTKWVKIKVKVVEYFNAKIHCLSFVAASTSHHTLGH